MGWREQLQQASFRGVPFYFTTADGTPGRRVEVHEYPLRDEPSTQDMGRKAKQFTLEVFVLGQDYMSQRDKLEAALDKEGSGILVHPRRGSLNVTLIDARGPRESTREGGYASFSLTFVEAGSNALPANQNDSSIVVDEAADAALINIGTDFQNVFNISGMPEFIAEDASSILTNMSGTLSGLVSSTALPGEIGDYADAAQLLTTNASSLVRTPGSLVSQVLSVVGRVGRIFSQPSQAFNPLASLFYYGDTRPVITQTTATRKQQAVNQQALLKLVQRSAALEAARTSSQMSFDSYADAVEVRDVVIDRLDVEIESTDDIAVFDSLRRVRAAVVIDIDTRADNLARIVNYTPTTTLPALVVAHRLYGDATQEADIVARNKIRHPGFVTGGAALEVKTNAA